MAIESSGAISSVEMELVSSVTENVSVFCHQGVDVMNDKRRIPVSSSHGL
jgi:hypothetical protein